MRNFFRFLAGSGIDDAGLSARSFTKSREEPDSCLSPVTTESDRFGRANPVT